jgi:hypothetical protein
MPDSNRGEEGEPFELKSLRKKLKKILRCGGAPANHRTGGTQAAFSSSSPIFSV